ncbi:MAG: hypothetical protein HKN28_14635 [Alphaproteobacteria bacterium]|nr:hypothetical protein [Alphaproteobacteria bacterium]
MANYYQPDLGANPDDPFARDADGKLVRRTFWLDMSDRSVVLAMTQGVGANLTNEQKRAHLDDIGRAHVVDDVCVQEIIPPDS